MKNIEFDYLEFNFEEYRQQAEILQKEIIALHVLSGNPSVLGKKRHHYNSEISQRNKELEILKGKLQYHRLNAFIDCAKGMIEKELYKKIWQEVDKKVPSIVISGRNSPVRKKNNEK